MKSIIYIEDIVKELSEELNIPEKELDELCRKSLIYASELTKNPKIISIRFPKLGVLHLNERLASSVRKTSNTYKYYKHTLLSQLQVISEEKEKHKNIVHARGPFMRAFKRYIFKNRLERVTKKKVELYIKLEHKQNKK